jgi:hypothetical protein
VRDDLLAVDDLYLEGSNYQDPYSGQDPYDEAMKLLATAGDDEPMGDGLKEDSHAISAPLSDENDKSQSPQLPPQGSCILVFTTQVHSIASPGLGVRRT